MNCQDAEQLVLARKDGALTDDKRTALEAHIAGCASCARLQSLISENSNHLRESAHTATMPDVADEWLEIRRRIQAPEPVAPMWSRLMPVLSVPLAAAAALVIAFFAVPQWFDRADSVDPVEPVRIAQFEWGARAEFVEMPGSDDTVVVYVDEPSGWLVVWAVTPSTDIGG